MQKGGEWEVPALVTTADFLFCVRDSLTPICPLPTPVRVGFLLAGRGEGGENYCHLKGDTYNQRKPRRHHVNTCVCTRRGGGRGETSPAGLALAARVDRGMVDRWVSKKVKGIVKLGWVVHKLTAYLKPHEGGVKK